LPPVSLYAPPQRQNGLLLTVATRTCYYQKLTRLLFWLLLLPTLDS